MEKKNLYNSFYSAENQALYRDKLIEMMTKNAISRFGMAKKIGISHITLRRYLCDEELLRDVTFSRVVAFIDSNHSENHE